MKNYLFFLLAVLALTSCEKGVAQTSVEHGGWVKYEGNPVLGGPELGTCFDANVIPDGQSPLNMYFSWRPKKAIALSRSEDGIKWTSPEIVLDCDSTTGWEDIVNRSSTLFWKGQYHMWYTGQTFPPGQPHGISKIGYAVSDDGVHFRRVQKEPVLMPEMDYEGFSVMNPYVMYDEERKVLRMWYSSGETYEPNVECYAESADGIHWQRSPLNPIFGKGAPGEWDCDRVGGLEVHRLQDGRFIMFYIGYSDINTARIGAAVSPDGITRWHRLQANPLVEPVPGEWDGHACYKPTVFHDRANKRWLLWYNGRKDANEFIGMAVHEGDDLLSTEPVAALPDSTLIEHYVADFNSHDQETYRQAFPNDKAADFLKANIPLFQCPDKELERTYYFRWWTYRKHVRQTPDGFVITEFLPNVGWAGKHNTINCPASHHFYEGRWLRNPRYLADYARFWFYGGGSVRSYSFPAADAVWNYLLVHPDQELEADLYEKLKENYAGWEKERLDSTNLFWQFDGNDGMEVSVSGNLSPDHSGYRPTINSYMYADAVALSRLAARRGEKDYEKLYAQKAAERKALMDQYLWDEKDEFYKVVPRHADLSVSPCREELGYVPWMYDIPDRDKLVAWEQLFDPQGFLAPYGPTTTEQRSPGFAVAYEGHECQWNGPSWPFATSQTLKAMARSLRRFGEEGLTRERYMQVLQAYSRSHRLGQQCFIDENLNPFTGDWIARTLLKQRGDVIPDRGKDYNHSTFVDNIISDLIGLQVDERGRISLSPLVPADYWDWFCLLGVPCQGHSIDIIYDRTGRHYGRGKGLQLIIDGKARRVKPKHFRHL